jgi:hypothetical protein
MSIKNEYHMKMGNWSELRKNDGLKILLFRRVVSTFLLAARAIMRIRNLLALSNEYSSCQTNCQIVRHNTVYSTHQVAKLRQCACYSLSAQASSTEINFFLLF